MGFLQLFKLSELINKGNPDNTDKMLLEDSSGDFKSATISSLSDSTNDTAPNFTEVKERENINSGEDFSTILGKIKKIFSDLHKFAFSGKYTDLTEHPESLKNPYPLTLSDTSDSVYDGSAEQTVHIPTKLSELENDSEYLTTDTDTWKENTATDEGYVAAGGLDNSNKVWRTDANGIPGWRENIADSSSLTTGVKGSEESSYRIGNVEITKDNIGLGKVENKTSQEILNTLTKEQVIKALGYTPRQKGYNTFTMIASFSCDNGLDVIANITATDLTSELEINDMIILTPEIVESEYIIGQQCAIFDNEFAGVVTFKRLNGTVGEYKVRFVPRGIDGSGLMQDDGDGDNFDIISEEVWLVCDFEQQKWMMKPDTYSLNLREKGKRLCSYVGRTRGYDDMVNIGLSSILTYYNLSNYILISIMTISDKYGSQSKIGMGLLVNRAKTTPGYRIEITSDKDVLPIGTKYKKYYENGQVSLRPTGEVEELEGGILGGVGNSGNTPGQGENPGGNHPGGSGSDVVVDGNQIFINIKEEGVDLMTIEFGDCLYFVEPFKVTQIVTHPTMTEPVFTDKVSTITCGSVTYSVDDIYESVSVEAADVQQE